MVKGTPVPADAVVLSVTEAAEFSDRVYQVRCAAEDVATMSRRPKRGRHRR